MHLKKLKSAINSVWKKIALFGWFIPVSHLFLILLGRYIPKRLSVRLMDKRNRAISNYLQSGFDFHCRSACNHLDKVEEYSSFNAPIWFCWLQGEENLSEIPALCLASIRRNSGNHPVVVLSMDNIAKYVELPLSVLKLYQRGGLKPAHFADILRVNLLAQRGGLWLDATLLLTRKIDESFFTNGFYTIKVKPFGNYISQCRWSVFCLASHPGNLLFTELSRLFNEYLSQHTEFIDYFLFDHFINLLYMNNESIRIMIDRVPVNNPQVHSLSRLLCDDFDDIIYKSMLCDTQLFKLSSRKYKKEQLHANSRSYHAHLLHIFGSPCK